MFEGIYDWFPYDRSSKESMKSCILDMADYMQKYLLPYFEKGNSCESAYDVVDEFEAASRSKVEEQNEKFAFSSYSHIRACMALKNGNYDAAVKHLEVMKTQWKQAYQRNIEVYQELQREIDIEYEQRMTNKLKELQIQIKRISRRDMDYINNFIQSNEQRSLQNLGLSLSKP